MKKPKPRPCVRCLGLGRVTLDRKPAVCPACGGSGNAPEREPVERSGDDHD